MIKKSDHTEIRITTKDNQVLTANYYANKESDKALLLIHEFTKNKDSWLDLIKVIKKDFSFLAIDLRGHGNSTGSYNDFCEKDFINIELDLLAAIDYLEKQKFSKKNISIIGSRIGANLAHNYGCTNEYHKIILLSPEKDHKCTELINKKIKELIILSEKDQYCFKTEKLFENSKLTKVIKLNNEEQGVALLNKELISSIYFYLHE